MCRATLRGCIPARRKRAIRRDASSVPALDLVKRTCRYGTRYTLGADTTYATTEEGFLYL